MTTMTPTRSSRVPSPLRRSLKKLGGGDSTSNGGSVAVPQSPGSFATDATARSSISGNNEDLFFRIVDSTSQDHLPGESMKGASSSFRNKASMWNSSPNLKVDPDELCDNKWEFDTIDFNSSFNGESRPRKGLQPASFGERSGEKAHALGSNRATPRRMSSFSMKPVVTVESRITPSVTKKELTHHDGLDGDEGTRDQKSEHSDSVQQPPSSKVKKRIKVRAGDLNLDNSSGSKSIDRQHVEDAVRRWQSEHGMSPSTDGDLSTMQRAVSRRRASTAIEGTNEEAACLNASDSGGDRIRVVVRRSKSLDESCSSFMASLAAGGENVPRRAARRSMTSTATAARARSKSRGRRSSATELSNGDDIATGSGRILPRPRQRSVSRGRRMSVSTSANQHSEESDLGDSTTCTQEAVSKSRQRSVSRGRRLSLAPRATDDSQTSSPRSRSRLRDRRQSCASGGEHVPAPRSHSLGRHLQMSNHEAQVNDKKSAMSGSRSVSLKSAGCESRESSMSAPGRLSTTGSGSILQRRRSRSMARADSRSSDSISGDLQASRKPLVQQHPMNDLTRNHRNTSEGGGSSAFSSRIAPPLDPPSPQETELTRLMKETGITTEQFLKLQEAGYRLKATTD